MEEEEIRREVCVPLLHSVETLEGWDGDKDDDSLLAVANFNLQDDQSQHASSICMVRSPSDSITTTPTTQYVFHLYLKYDIGRTSAGAELSVFFEAAFQLPTSTIASQWLTSLAETNWSGRSAAFKSGVLVSRS